MRSSPAGQSGPSTGWIKSGLLCLFELFYELEFDEHVLFIEDILVDQLGKLLVEFERGVDFEKGIKLDVVSAVRPASRCQIFLLYLLVNFHIFTIVEHEVEDDSMHFFKEKIWAIVVNFDDTCHDAFVLRLI